MTDFEIALDACLAGLQDGALTVEACVARYPEHAARLGPLLRAAEAARRQAVDLPSPVFKGRLRAQLLERGSGRAAPVFSRRLLLRPAAALTALSLMLITTGTAFAQAALPGNVLYSWKLASERAWRRVAIDSVSVDLAIARRRADEWIAVATDTALGAKTFVEYREVLERVLAADSDENHARIQAELEDQKSRLAAAGLTPPPFEDLVPPNEPLEPVTPVAPTYLGTTATPNGFPYTPAPESTPLPAPPADGAEPQPGPSPAVALTPIAPPP